MQRNDQVILVRPNQRNGHQFVNRRTGKYLERTTLPDDLRSWEPVAVPGLPLLRERKLEYFQRLRQRREEDYKEWFKDKTRTRKSKGVSTRKSSKSSGPRTNKKSQEAVLKALKFMPPDQAAELRKKLNL